MKLLTGSSVADRSPRQPAKAVMLLAGIAIAAAMSSTSARAQESESPERTVYAGAQVWNGERFELRDIAVAEGKIVDFDEPGGAKVVDVAGSFITPALSDAHNHVTAPAEWSSSGFLGQGVYYVWNPTTVTLGDSAAPFFARSETVDVKLAYGGITEPRGHPERLYVEDLSERVYGGRTNSLGDAFHYGRDQEEIEAALDLLVQQGADFVKGYLLYSEEYLERADDDSFYGRKGLNPANARVLVSEAAERDLLVTFHVETAADLVTAAEAGAFAAMHLPGHGIARGDNGSALQTLREDQAMAVANSGMLLVPTFIIAQRAAERAETNEARSRAALTFAVQRHNLALLNEAGGRFLIGTDGFGSVVDELDHLQKLAVFSSYELLQIAFGTGPLLFPERRIGCLEVGCEADFLVLAANPADDLNAFRQIRIRVKGGAELE